MTTKLIARFSVLCLFICMLTALFIAGDAFSITDHVYDPSMVACDEPGDCPCPAGSDLNTILPGSNAPNCGMVNEYCNCPPGSIFSAASYVGGGSACGCPIGNPSCCGAYACPQWTVAPGATATPTGCTVNCATCAGTDTGGNPCSFPRVDGQGPCTAPGCPLPPTGTCFDMGNGSGCIYNGVTGKCSIICAIAD